MEQIAKIEVFRRDGMELRSLLINGEPWFIAADACRALDLGNVTQALSRLDADETTLISNEGREINVVSEAGLYALVLGSRKPEAKAFKRWVTHEVLPTLRKTGTYSIVDALSRRDLAMLILEAELEREKAHALLQAQAPLVAYAEKVQASPTSFTVDTTAKELGLPVVKFREFVQGRYLFRRGRDWLPYAEHQDRGLFEVRTRTYEHNGVEITYHTTLVTGQGRIALKAAWERSQEKEAAEAAR
jgi:anti-repressor protein